MDRNSIESNVAKPQTSDGDDHLFLGGLPVILSGKREADKKVVEACLSMKGSNATRVNYRRHIDRLFENFPGRTLRSMTCHHIARILKILKQMEAQAVRVNIQDKLRRLRNTLTTGGSADPAVPDGIERHQFHLDTIQILQA